MDFLNDNAFISLLSFNSKLSSVKIVAPSVFHMGERATQLGATPWGANGCRFEFRAEGHRATERIRNGLDT